MAQDPRPGTRWAKGEARRGNVPVCHLHHVTQPDLPPTNDRNTATKKESRRNRRTHAQQTQSRKQYPQPLSPTRQRSRIGRQRRRMSLDCNPLVFHRGGRGDRGACGGSEFLGVRGGAGRLIRLLFRRHTLLRVRFDAAIADVRLRGRRGFAVDDGNDGVGRRARARGDDTLEFHRSISAVGLLGFGSFPFLELLQRLGWKKKGESKRAQHERRETKRSCTDLFHLSLFLLDSEGRSADVGATSGANI